MLFNSFIFILLFLPICLIGYFGLNHYRKYKAAKAFLLGMSLWFYGYFQIYYLMILAGSIVINYGLYQIIRTSQNGWEKKEGTKTGGRRPGFGWMIAGVILNLSVLLFFKYTDFLIHNINQLIKVNVPLLRIMLPLGISFFTFQQVGFLVDTYRGDVGKYRFLDYALFVAFFPQLIAGPIVTHQELVPQFQEEEKKRLRIDNFSTGCVSFILGLAKKVLLADVLAVAVTYGYDNIKMLNTGSALIVMLAFYFQIYFDFSGYSDMAIGLGKMLNLDLPVNFDSPYKGKTVREFWKRWHMTLTRFFTRYVYIPLGGSRQGTLKTYRNILIVFTLSGIWHGAGWGFVVWGVSAGIGIILCRIFEKTIQSICRSWIGSAAMWIVNMLYISFSWVFFKAENLHTAGTFIRRLFSGGMMPCEGLLESFRVEELFYALKLFGLGGSAYTDLFLCLLYMLTSFVIVLLLPNVQQMLTGWKPKVWHAIGLAGLFLWSFISLAGVSTFIYYNF